MSAVNREAIVEQLNWRYATKKFDSSKKLTQEQLDELLESARLSASSFGLQPYKLVVVTDPVIRAKLREHAWNQPQVWAFIALYGLGALPLGFVLYDSSLYLSAALHKTQAQIGAVLWIPPLGWEAGYFFWGWIMDRFMKSGANLGRLRRLFFALAVLSVSLALIPLLNSFAATMALFFFTMFLAAGFIIGSLAFANNYYSAQHAGVIAGLGAGSWSALVAVIMPGMGRLFDLHMYGAAFFAATVFPLVGTGIWWVLSRSSVPSRP